jgi:hypothetical protein
VNFLDSCNQKNSSSFKHLKFQRQFTFFQRFSENQAVAPGDRDGVEQRLFLQIVVNQRRDNSKLRQSQPCRDELGTIFHQQSNFVAMFEAVLVENICNAIFEIVDL